MVFRATEDPPLGLLQLLFIQSQRRSSKKFGAHERRTGSFKYRPLAATMSATGEEEPSEATPMPDTLQPTPKDTAGDPGSVVEFQGTPISGRPRDNNLPLQLTDLVERERKIKEVENLLSEHRLLTLTGPGGSSSTRFCWLRSAWGSLGFRRIIHSG